jgi:tetratricopeptide (TPR) repeat protein
MRRLIAMLILLASPVVLADAKKATPDELRKYRAALKQGQSLAGKGDHAGALAAFNQALAVFPDDPVVLDEMGTVYYKQKDFANAETMARRAAARTPDAKLRGRALFNLGRIQEARNEKDKAIDSYKRSLDDRPNRIVRERLAALDPASAAEKDRFAPAPMAGPFRSIKEWCERSDIKKSCDERDDDGDGQPDDENSKEKPEFTCNEKGLATLAKPPAPVSAARVVSAQCNFHNGKDIVTEDFSLAVRVGDQWFVGDLADSLNSMRQTQTVEAKTIEARPLVAGGPMRLVVHVSTMSMYRGMDANTHDTVVIAGVGASGKPSITRPILEFTTVDEDDPETGENKSSHGGKLKLNFQAGDALEITLGKKDGSGIDKETLAPLLGKHVLLFP